MTQSNIVASFLGALQASLAVLLTIGYGVLASRQKLLKASSARDISKACVRLFLPALMITNVGSELRQDTAAQYIPVLLWALTHTLLSMGLGWTLKRLFRFPAWAVPAMCFNNTTALPLVLIQSLESAGILSDLVKDEHDSTSAAVRRATSYFLISAMVGNSLTFAMGPKLLDDEEIPDQKEENMPSGREQYVDPNNDESARINHEERRESTPDLASRASEDEESQSTERTALLPSVVERPVIRVYNKASKKGGLLWGVLPLAIQKGLSAAGQFMNAPLAGAIIGAILGLTPSLHRAFFESPEKGGIFSAWLTVSIENIGGLFASLQLIVVGLKLSSSLDKSHHSEGCGFVPWVPMLTIFLVRFIVWPVISISVVYLLASKTKLLADDPMLWFVLMLIPTGPTTTKLVALADVSGANEAQKMSISKFLTISYAVSPIICITVVGSLRAALAVR